MSAFIWSVPADASRSGPSLAFEASASSWPGRDTVCVLLQKETPSDQQLHLAALQGNVEQLRKVLETGKVHVDCKDKVSEHGASATVASWAAAGGGVQLKNIQKRPQKGNIKLQ